MPSHRELTRTLQRLDGRGYRAYKDLRGAWSFPDLTLFIDHVQGDPFAAPSRVRVRIPMRVAGLPAPLFRSRVRRTALEDFLARVVRSQLPSRSGPGSGKSGLIAIDAGGQEVLERTAVVVTDEWVEARLEVGLPAAGRRILGPEAGTLLTERVPGAVRGGLCWRPERRDAAEAFVYGTENQEHIRARLDSLGLAAFVANGSILPRESGATDLPLGDGSDGRAVPFVSPPSLEVCVDVPHEAANGDRAVRGMGIPRGVTLIVGGGYHGKSTLLQALERAVYPHVPGDGRELVVAAPGLVKVRAEDGRRIERVDIHAFIDSLPPGPEGRAPDTRAFSSDDASGSTSQAASIVEAIEAGATGLLLDEDTCATNFMIRDARMQALVEKEHEPITPFVDRVRELYDEHGVSTILVMGGCGDYFEAADHVIMMRDYRAFEVTEEARKIAREQVSARRVEKAGPMPAPTGRVPEAASFDASRGRREVKIDVKERDRILYGRELIDLCGAPQLVDRSQTRAIGLAIHLAAQRFMRAGATLAEVLDALDRVFDDDGLEALDPAYGPRTEGSHPGNLARPRRFEIAAAINRLRTVSMSGAASRSVRKP